MDPIGLAGGLNLYGFANGDPINFSDPFGLSACPPECGEVFEQLASVSRGLKTAFEVGAAITLAPVVVVAAAEVGAAVGAAGVTAVAARATTTAIQRAEVAALSNSATSLVAGVVESIGRAAVSDIGGHKTLPLTGPAPNLAWSVGRGIGTALYYGAKIGLARQGVIW